MLCNYLLSWIFRKRKGRTNMNKNLNFIFNIGTLTILVLNIVWALVVYLLFGNLSNLYDYWGLPILLLVSYLFFLIFIFFMLKKKNNE